MVSAMSSDIRDALYQGRTLVAQGGQVMVRCGLEQFLNAELSAKNPLARPFLVAVRSYQEVVAVWGHGRPWGDRTNLVLL